MQDAENLDDLHQPLHDVSNSATSEDDHNDKSRCQRPKWTREEEKILVEAHCTLGNAWVAIAELLPGRTAVEVKNIWHSTLRARDPDTRCILRAYIHALRDRAEKPAARQQALRVAQQVFQNNGGGGGGKMRPLLSGQAKRSSGSRVTGRRRAAGNNPDSDTDNDTATPAPPSLDTRTATTMTVLRDEGATTAAEPDVEQAACRTTVSHSTPRRTARKRQRCEDDTWVPETTRKGSPAPQRRALRTQAARKGCAGAGHEGRGCDGDGGGGGGGVGGPLCGVLNGATSLECLLAVGGGGGSGAVGGGSWPPLSAPNRVGPLLQALGCLPLPASAAAGVEATVMYRDLSHDLSGGALGFTPTPSARNPTSPDENPPSWRRRITANSLLGEELTASGLRPAASLTSATPTLAAAVTSTSAAAATTTSSSSSCGAMPTPTLVHNPVALAACGRGPPHGFVAAAAAGLSGPCEARASSLGGSEVGLYSGGCHPDAVNGQGAATAAVVAVGAGRGGCAVGGWAPAGRVQVSTGASARFHPNMLGWDAGGLCAEVAVPRIELGSGVAAGARLGFSEVEGGGGGYLAGSSRTAQVSVTGNRMALRSIWGPALEPQLGVPLVSETPVSYWASKVTEGVQAPGLDRRLRDRLVLAGGGRLSDRGYSAGVAGWRGLGGFGLGFGLLQDAPGGEVLARLGARNAVTRGPVGLDCGYRGRSGGSEGCTSIGLDTITDQDLRACLDV